MRRLTITLTVALAVTAWSVLASACSDDDSVASRPTSVLSASEIEHLQADAAEFAASYYGSWPDIDAALDRMVEDVVAYDPSDGDFILEGKTNVVSLFRGFANYFSGTEWLVDDTFLSANGAAYRVVVAGNYWPPWMLEPPGHAPVVELDEVRFKDGDITNFDIWFEDETLEMLEFGCFAIEGCPGLQAIVDGYIAAWSSGVEDRIAALYDDNAVFTDSLLGIVADGPANIGVLAEARFGRGDTTVEVVAVYAQTSGPTPATEEQRDSGPVIAVGIHYRISDAGGTTTLDSLTTFELGTRQPAGFDLHPQGLITREEVFHDPVGLLMGGLTS